MSLASYISDPSSASSSSGEEDEDKDRVNANVYNELASSSNSDSEESGPASSFSLGVSDTTPLTAARAYQREMLDESLKQNVIVAMDTGSGKTHVAVLRIREELERDERGDKFVWFLVPTVDLAEQQLAVLERDIPAVQSKMICGRDRVDSWSDQYIWDRVLLNTSVVVSTYQILFDALSHGFVSLESLSLLVFDEAHNCTKKNVGARLMSEFYWPTKTKGEHVPHILGLTASPSMGSNISDIETLEQILDAVCRVPHKYRDELIAHAHRPEMIAEIFKESLPQSQVQLRAQDYTPSMLSLRNAYGGLDIREDPYIHKLRSQNTEKSREKLRRAVEKNETYCQRQMKAFCRRSQSIWRELGPWAADYYIQKVIAKILVDAAKDSDAEKKHLAKILQAVEVDLFNSEPDRLTNKVEVLLKILQSHGSDTVGIIFAKERATVAVLTHIIAIHPLTRGQYRVASRVGASEISKKESYLDLGQKDDMGALQSFRTRKRNLLVATSVLEEGIDVPACNLVFCFDEPANLKSFIQRRGRARMRSSRLYLLLSMENENGKNIAFWHELENEMKRQYEDEERERKALEEVEYTYADTSEYPVLEVPSTGARITVEDAKSHLEHFCATLSTRKFVDWSPYYIVRPDHNEGVSPNNPGILKATVHLPVSLAPELRKAESLWTWRSERLACNDAAFQAYLKLHRAGLLNDNLLPLKETSLAKEKESLQGIMTVDEQMNPWVEIAQSWRGEHAIHRRRLRISDHTGMRTEEIDVVLPRPWPELAEMMLYWDSSTHWIVNMDEDVQISQSSTDDGVDHTATILSSAFGHRGHQWAFHEKQFLARFVLPGHDIKPTDLAALEFDEQAHDARSEGVIVRDVANKNHPYFYVDWLPSKPPADTIRRIYEKFEEDPDDVPYVVLRNWPKYTGYFHSIKPNPTPETLKPYPRVLPANRLKQDNFPAVVSQFGMLIPAIMHALEVRLLAEELRAERMSSVGLTDLSLVATAISAPAARETTNYEKIEFLGDTILKFCTTVNCCAKRPEWPEGYLSAMKDRIVSNANLCQRSRDFKLDRYIVTKGIAHKKWRPTFVEDLLKNPPSMSAKRDISSKTLADVVEALIGASFLDGRRDGGLDGGITRALSCMSLLIPDAFAKNGLWETLDICRGVLFDRADAEMLLPASMQPLENLLGYQFEKKSLLIEAATHSSYSLGHACFERLEFLGDAVLDYVVVTQIFEHDLEHFDMHLLRTALVNADFLGFLSMNWHTKQERIDVEVADNSATTATEEESFRLKDKELEMPLCSFLRYDSGEMGLTKKATAQRFAQLRAQIQDAISSGDRYPWALLARLQIPKFYSDVFESVLGAVWVDSGSLDECIQVAERAGILPYLRRMVKDGVRILHPKEELGRLAVDKKVVYEVDVREEEEGEREFLCKIWVGDELLAEVAGGVSREEARTRAAGQAVRTLKSRVNEK